MQSYIYICTPNQIETIKALCYTKGCCQSSTCIAEARQETWPWRGVPQSGVCFFLLQLGTCMCRSESVREFSILLILSSHSTTRPAGLEPNRCSPALQLRQRTSRSECLMYPDNPCRTDEHELLFRRHRCGVLPCGQRAVKAHRTKRSVISA